MIIVEKFRLSQVTRLQLPCRKRLMFLLLELLRLDLAAWQP